MAALLLVAGCSTDPVVVVRDGGADLAVPIDASAPADFSVDAAPSGDMARVPGTWCTTPGSVRWMNGAPTVVAGGPAGTPNLQFIHLPDGFCAHYYATVPDVRQLRFAPGGELFAASPTVSTTGGGPNGRAAIVVLPDDDKDGVADSQSSYMDGLPATQGLLFANAQLYFQDGTKIMRVPYKAGDRVAAGPAPALVADVNAYVSLLHWPKMLDMADDGTIYVTNGGDQSEACDLSKPFHGGILQLDGSPGGKQVARGFRNPIALRCPRGHNRCFALELALDYSDAMGGREKMVQVHAGDDWGFPCCATKNLPYKGVMGNPDCSGVQAESASFLIGDTPMGVDFELGNWPAPWKGSAIVALHGDFGSWRGTRVVSIAMDPATGLPLPATDLRGQPTGAMRDFATGWDDKTLSHGRPDDVIFSSDGRMFLGNDVNGDIIWIAPL